MTYILHIRAVQDPFELPSDQNGRILFSCNYDVASFDHDDLEREILSLISSASIVPASRQYLGMDQPLPLPSESLSPDGPFVRIILTGGYSPQITRKSLTPKTKRRPSFQILTASQDRDLARQCADDIFNLLHRVNQVTT